MPGASVVAECSVPQCINAGGQSGLRAGSPAPRGGSHAAERGWVWFRRRQGAV